MLRDRRKMFEDGFVCYSGHNMLFCLLVNYFAALCRAYHHSRCHAKREQCDLP